MVAKLAYLLAGVQLLVCSPIPSASRSLDRYKFPYSSYVLSRTYGFVYSVFIFIFIFTGLVTGLGVGSASGDLCTRFGTKWVDLGGVRRCICEYETAEMGRFRGGYAEMFYYGMG